jgi:hypothetical protein
VIVALGYAVRAWRFLALFGAFHEVFSAIPLTIFQPDARRERLWILIKSPLISVRRKGARSGELSIAGRLPVGVWVFGREPRSGKKGSSLPGGWRGRNELSQFVVVAHIDAQR